MSLLTLKQSQQIARELRNEHGAETTPDEIERELSTFLARMRRALRSNGLYREAALSNHELMTLLATMYRDGRLTFLGDTDEII